MTDFDILKQFFSLQNPLGDIAAIENADGEGRIVFQSYFDLNNQPYQSLKREPSMIVGRKGSGKTDALLSYRYGSQRHTSRYDPVIYFKANEAASIISTLINQVTDVVVDNYPPPTVESISEFWNNLFWIAVLRGILASEKGRSSEQYLLIQRFLSALIDAEEIPKNPYHLVISAIVGFKKNYATSDFRSASIGFFSAQERLTFSGLTIGDAKIAAQAWLRKNGHRAIVLFDSIEALDISEIHNKMVISGLLKAVGAFQSASSTAQFRCCVPAESYFSLIEMSSNVLKDFRNNQILHWHSSELLRICAKRYSAFLRIHSPESMKEFVEPFADFETRDSVLSFWRKVLPDQVPNTKERKEATLPYITRHTQLLPRHFLLIFNHIISSSIQKSKSAAPSLIDEATIIEGISRTESLIVDQVLDSYRRIWPDADAILKGVLPDLNKNIVGLNELHKVFNRSGAKKNIFRGVDNFDDFIRMSSELGVIGRLIERTENYATTAFEYGEPHRLLFTDIDTVCIHPIFTERYRVIVPEQKAEDYLPVYPLGTDPASADYRDR